MKYHVVAKTQEPAVAIALAQLNPDMTMIVRKGATQAIVGDLELKDGMIVTLELMKPLS